MTIIRKYFPHISDKQYEQLLIFKEIFTKKNIGLNLISRKDIENLEIHHILHSLSIARFIRFKPGTRIMDVGTGGGFPGIPLAVIFPECRFVLTDSIAKKMRAVSEIVEHLKLTNVETRISRSENIREKFDFITARAVTAFPDFVKAVSHGISHKHSNAVPNGIIYLKGGEFESEIETFKKIVVIQNISEYFDEEYFETKKIIFLPF